MLYTYTKKCTPLWSKRGYYGRDQRFQKTSDYEYTSKRKFLIYSHEGTNTLADEQEAKEEDDNKLWEELIACFPEYLIRQMG